MVAELSAWRYFKAFSMKKRDLGRNDFQHAEVVAGKRIRFGPVECQYPDHATKTRQGHNQGRTEVRSSFRRIREAGLKRRVPVDDGLRVLLLPSRRDLLPWEQPAMTESENVSADEFGHQKTVLGDEGDN